MSNPSNPNEVLVREDHPLPGTVAGIKALIEEILTTPGRTERIVVEVGHMVRVQRWKKRGPLEEEDMSLEAAMRQAETMYEIAEVIAPRGTIFEMLKWATDNGLHPVCWAVGSSDETLWKWLGFRQAALGESRRNLLGIPVETQKNLPEETIALAASSRYEGGIRDISHIVKATMEVPSGKQKHQGAAPRVGHHSRGRDSAVREVEDAQRERGTSGWKPPSF